MRIVTTEGNGKTLQVDVDTLTWQKSTKSDNSGPVCVEIAFWGGQGANSNVAMRDSKDPNGPVLLFDNAEWDAFVVGAKAGEFDV